ncbi:MAG: hypothetical protein N2662_12000 [Bacteroidales bacterium]|nr:hypothetical protein [Bacteroidales bacterium]
MTTMVDLKISFLELTLPNPFILEINPFTSPNDFQLAKLYGGVLLSSIPFEILNNSNQEENLLENYFVKISEWKNSIETPLIASIDGTIGMPIDELCAQLEKEGVDALNLRLFFFPDDKDFRSNDYEKIFLEAVAKISYSIKIPVLITLPIYFTNLFNMVEQLFYRGVQGFCPTVYQPVFDVDIDQHEYFLKSYSDSEFCHGINLKWIAYLSAYFPRADFATQLRINIHPDEPIKHLLAGANALILKPNDPAQFQIEQLLNCLSNWMEKFGFEKIEHFHGQLNFQSPVKPSIFERKSIIESLRNNNKSL